MNVLRLTVHFLDLVFRNFVTVSSWRNAFHNTQWRLLPGYYEPLHDIHLFADFGT